MACNQVGLTHTIQSANMHSLSDYSGRNITGYILYQSFCLSRAGMDSKEKFVFDPSPPSG